MTDFLYLLKSKELKATPQRLSVLKELEKKNHPTIEQLYEALREDNPSMSLATVYKNIATLKEKGVVIEVNVSDGKMRYDIVQRLTFILYAQIVAKLKILNMTKR